jgi:hypothetical protein
MRPYKRCNRCHGVKQRGTEDSATWHETLRLLLCRQCKREVFALLNAEKRARKPRRFVIPQ